MIDEITRYENTIVANENVIQYVSSFHCFVMQEVLASFNFSCSNYDRTSGDTENDCVLITIFVHLKLYFCTTPS